MGADPSVVVNVQFVQDTEDVTHLQRGLLMFTAFDPTFEANYITAANLYSGIALPFTRANYIGLLDAFAAPGDEPVRAQLGAFWRPRGAKNDNGNRPIVRIGDEVWTGRRTRSAVTEYLLTIGGGDPPPAGTITITICPKGTGDGEQRQLTFVAQELVIADGILSLAAVRNAAVAQLNGNADFAAIAVAAPGGADGELTITTNTPGYPLVVSVASTVGGPTIVADKVSTHVAGNFELDFDDIRAAVEQNGPAAKREFYWCTDGQYDDDVNEEAFAYMDTLDADPSEPEAYQYHGQSNSPLNFDALSAGTSPAEIANAAGYKRASVVNHPYCENLVAAEYGRCIAYTVGNINFHGRELNGDDADAIMTQVNYGANEPLATDRFFNYYGDEGVAGMFKWGYTAESTTGSERFWDQKWLEDILEFEIRQSLTRLQQSNDIIPYTDEGIAQGEAAILAAATAIPALITDTISVTSVPRREVNPSNLVSRTYVDYTVRAEAAGAINRFGTKAIPIAVTVSIT